MLSGYTALINRVKRGGRLIVGHLLGGSVTRFEESLPYASKAAERLGVSQDVHPNDFIYDYVLNHPNFSTLEGAVAEYFESGRRSAMMLSNLLVELGYNPEGALSMLEFASGYGCFTRHLPVVMPRLKSTACDIHAEAVDFIVNRLHQAATISNSVPEQLDLPERYDVVFALSFFSHMPRSTWGRWISALYRHIGEGGVLLFTTHGDLSRKYFGDPIIPEDGFWFRAFSEQGDLDPGEYGATIVTKAFVDKEIKTLTGQPVTMFKEGYWWGHQDLYGVVKRSK